MDVFFERPDLLGLDALHGRRRHEPERESLFGFLE